MKRLGAEIPKICLNCKLLLSCLGICTQKIIEEGDNVNCIMETSDMSIRDHIIYNFNRHFLAKKYNYEKKF